MTPVYMTTMMIKSPTGAQLWTLPQANETTNSTKHETKLQL